MWSFTFSAGTANIGVIDSSIAEIVGGSVGGLIAVTLVTIMVVIAVGLLLKLKTKSEWPHWALIVPLNQVDFIYCHTQTSGLF